ncbi:EamA family transporter [Sphingorhabdus sp. Alg239-R122]|uniref:DMT family transporter n=1 Tax=Sphingorhabdus sp. Alg239-R122 TaxID=2305989 RepID=UPI0013DC5029|nr:EamA family transporter [Sphingorhabdus sp. Alg239-R122]
MINQQMSRFDWAMLVALSILWGGSFFFVEVAIEVIPPLTLVWLRVTLAALALWAFMLLRGTAIAKNWELWAAFAMMGLLNNMLPFVLIAWGQQTVSSGLASILNATTPLFTVIVAGFFLKDEQFTKAKLMGVLCGLMGIVLLIGMDVLHGIGANIIAQLAVLCAAISYAFAGVFGRRFQAMGVEPVMVALGQLVMSALFLLPMAFYFDNPLVLVTPDYPVWLSIIALALFSTALAYILYFRLLATAGATNLLLVTFLIPVSAIALGTIFLGETLGLTDFAAMALIALGMAIIDGRLFEKE